MGIYDRDWYKRTPDERFKQSESEKAQNEGAMRDVFERFTKGFSRRHSGNRNKAGCWRVGSLAADRAALRSKLALLLSS